MLNRISINAATISFAILSLVVCCALFYTAPVPALKVSSPKVIAVHVTKPHLESYTPSYQAYGRVETSTLVTLRSRVEGEINYINPLFNQGELLTKGQRILHVDDRDLKSQLTSAKIALAIAKADYQLELGEQHAAKREYNLMFPNAKESKSSLQKSLLLRQPQLAKALANVEAAQARVELTQRNLARSEVLSTGHFVVLDKSVYLGDTVEKNQVIGQLADMENLRVTLALPSHIVSQLAVGQRVSVNSSTRTYSAVLSQIGVKLQSNSQLQPVYLTLEPDGFMPVLGEFVSAQLLLATHEQTFRLPISALDNDKFWLVDEAFKLSSQQAHVIWRDSDSVILANALLRDQKLVTSKIYDARDGMLVSIVEAL